MNQPLFEVKELKKHFRSGKVITKAVDGAKIKLGGEPAPTGQYPVVFSPDAMASLLSTFSVIFSSERAQKGLSQLADKEGEIIAAGRMDLLLMNKDGKLGVADIKRTAKLDESYLRYQTTLYGMGVKYCYNIDPQFYACVWLRKKESAYRILRPDERLVNLLLEEVWNENQSKAVIPYGGIE